IVPAGTQCSTPGLGSGGSNNENESHSALGPGPNSPQTREISRQIFHLLLISAHFSCAAESPTVRGPLKLIDLADRITRESANHLTPDRSPWPPCILPQTRK